MRWLIFLDTDHLSGPARLALDFAVQARQLGHEVLMLGLIRGTAADSAFSRAVAAAGVPVSLLRERFRFDPAIRGQFKRLLDDFRPDIYQSHGYKGSMFGALARRRGARWQAIFHGFTWENRLVRLYHWLDMRWLRGADEVIVVSPAFGRELARRGIDRARLRFVPNAIDEEALRRTRSGASLREEWGAADPRKVLAGVIGRFSPEKAPDHFLRAMARAAPRRPDLCAVMVGDGPLLEDCRRLIAELDLADRVVLAGFRDDLASIYEALDLLVIPSRSEGLPTVMLEAMLLGVPVISTAVGAVPDLVGSGEGAAAIVVPVEDSAALATALERLANDAALRAELTEAGRALVRERLGLERRTRTLIEHAQALIAGEPPPEEITA